MGIKSFINKFIGIDKDNVEHKNQSHKDPVCGMRISNELIPTDYQGKEYYFCSERCKEQFLANPSNYIEQ